MSDGENFHIRLAPEHVLSSHPLRISELDKTCLSANEIIAALDKVLESLMACKITISENLQELISKLKLECKTYVRESSRIKKTLDMSLLDEAWSEKILETGFRIQLSYDEVSRKLVEELKQSNFTMV